MYRTFITYIIGVVLSLQIGVMQEILSINPSHGSKGQNLDIVIELADFDFYNIYNQYNGYNDYYGYNDYFGYNDYDGYKDYFSIFLEYYNDNFRDSFTSTYNEIISNNGFVSSVNIPNFITALKYNIKLTFANLCVRQGIGTRKLH